MSFNAYLVSNSGVMTIHTNGQVYTVAPDHANYAKLKDAVKAKKYNKVAELVELAKPVQEKVARCKKAKGRVKVEGGAVTFMGETVNNAVTNRIMEFVKEGFDFDPLVAFLDKLMENPSKESLDNLYRFLDANNNPITADGDFLAYKRVRDDYKDFHSGTFNNSVGQVVEMRRNNVQDDPNQTCAAGLHVAALSYARDSYHSGQGHLIVVKVNPKDVVSVPTDYNNTKMRVCKYEVVEEFEKEYRQCDVSSYEDINVLDDDDDYDDDEDDNDTYDDDEA